MFFWLIVKSIKLRKLSDLHNKLLLQNRNDAYTPTPSIFTFDRKGQS